MLYASWFVCFLVMFASFPPGGVSVSRIPPQTTAGTGFTGAPYSARETTVRTQTLSDGAKSSQTFATLLWRDTEGRTRRELIRRSASGGEIHSIILTDPVKGVYLKWEVGSDRTSREVALWPMPPAQKITAPPPPGSIFHVRPTTAAPRPGVQQEMLTPQYVNGVYCQGSRMTRTVQLDEESGSRTIQATNELWISPELRIIVRHVTDDPRSGRVVTDVTEVVRGDPDPGLFEPPEGYKLVVYYPNNTAQ